MSLGFLLFYAAPAATYRRAAHRHLQAHFPDASEQVWRSTSTLQSRLAPSRPHHSAGVNLLMRYMEWSCALYGAVQEQGMSQAEAAVLVETIMWDAFQPVTAGLFKLSRLRSAKRETRVKWLLGMMIRRLFTAPFCHRTLPSKTGVEFDVLVCPLADYFKDQGVPELTEPAAGNLDYRMAREWGAELVRTQTIADGAAHCDFRFRFPATGVD